MNKLTGYLVIVCALAGAERVQAQDSPPNQGALSLMAGVVLSLVTIVVVSVLSPRPSIERLARVHREPVDDFKRFAAAAAANEV